MELELIDTLSESAIFRSKHYLDRFSDEQNANLLYLYVVTLYGLYKKDETREWTKDYISRTLAFGNFNHFRNAGTDLYVLAHLMENNKYFNTNTFKKFLMDMRFNRTMAPYVYLSSLERQLRIRNPIYKNSKRVFVNWDDERTEKKRQAFKSLYRELYYITPVAEILKPMQNLREERLWS